MTSFTSPGTVYRYSFEEKKGEEQSVYRVAKVDGINPDDFVSEQVFYESKDGTKVPMFITRPAGYVRLLLRLSGKLKLLTGSRTMARRLRSFTATADSLTPWTPSSLRAFLPLSSAEGDADLRRKISAYLDLGIRRSSRRRQHSRRSRIRRKLASRGHKGEEAERVRRLPGASFGDRCGGGLTRGCRSGLASTSWSTDTLLRTRSPSRVDLTEDCSSLLALTRPLDSGELRSPSEWSRAMTRRCAS